MTSHVKEPYDYMLSNAGLQQPKARPDDGQRISTWHQTVMREGHAETAERGFGLLQGFVSNPAYSFS